MVERVRWVSVPVPEEMVPHVMAVVLEGTRQRELDEEAPPPEDAYRGSWTEDELRDALQKATRSMGIVLRYLAVRPEEKVDGPTLAEEVYGEGASANQIGGALGSFKRRIKSTYGKTKWPFSATYDDERHLWEYSMDARTAETIRRILGL
jgi:hypothetical protein